MSRNDNFYFIKAIVESIYKKTLNNILLFLLLNYVFLVFLFYIILVQNDLKLTYKTWRYSFLGFLALFFAEGRGFINELQVVFRNPFLQTSFPLGF
jgi:hypothetical protein